MKYNKIALIGMMGSGKTTVAELLSKKLNLEKIDTDEIFVKNFGDISEYFEKEGEASFREKESAILSDISKKDEFVLSCGGGIVLNEENRELLFCGKIFTIYLKTDPKEILKRLLKDDTRPLLKSTDRLRTIKDILSQREQYYQKADLIVNTDLKSPETVALEIIEKLNSSLKVNFFGRKTSEIIIEKGLADNIDEYLSKDKNYFLITNTILKRLYPWFISKFDEDKVIVIKDGERYKNFKTFNDIAETLLSKNIERKDCIIAFGGGVVGDMAGFVASTVLRGVGLIQIPTTLLAMCDSSIGGKTGYNSKFGKNLIGSFYLADKVLIDSNFLNTLNNYEYKCGLGEIVKYALIEKSCKCLKEYNLIEYLKNSDIGIIADNIDKIIEICVNLKANVVNLDNKEQALRKILNFGHTFAHPIETLSDYKEFSHGEAVAYGIKIASRLSYNLGKIDGEYLSLINRILDNFELAQNEIKYPASRIIELMHKDKKVLNKKINLLLPTAPAVVGLFDDIDLPLIEVSLL